MKDHSHAKHGKFGRIAQYPSNPGDRLSSEHTSLKPRNPSWPGPGAYTPGEISKPLSKMPPFLISSQRTDKKSTKNFNNNFVSDFVFLFAFNASLKAKYLLFIIVWMGVGFRIQSE